MTDLDRLIEAVKAGVIATDQISDAFGNGWDDILVLAAFDGSLDAALRLHEALLPGWRARIDVGRRFRAWVISDQNAKIDAYAYNPARAWLLAILRALKAKGDA